MRFQPVQRIGHINQFMDGELRSHTRTHGLSGIAD
jgi:hypothetical protein